jgi:zinc D-Ala-D-Ala carboxypeptidase
MTWRHFSADEFACRCGCRQNLIDHTFITELDDLRHHLGFALPISSGYRCPDHNAKVSSTGRTGPHTTGRAADIAVSHARAYDVLQAAMMMRFTGIGINQKGGGRFIHLDNLPDAPGQPRPTVWSY